MDYRKQYLMDLEKLQTVKKGEYTTAQIVEIFGNETHKRYMRDIGRLNNGKQRNDILQDAKRFCKIKINYWKKFVISEVYEYPIPKNFKRRNNELHRYVTPLILNSLISSVEAESSSVLLSDLVNSFYIKEKRDLISIQQKKKILNNYPFNCEIIQRYNIEYHNLLNHYIQDTLGFLTALEIIKVDGRNDSVKVFLTNESRGKFLLSLYKVKDYSKCFEKLITEIKFKIRQWAKIYYKNHPEQCKEFDNQSHFVELIVKLIDYKYALKGEEIV